MPPTSALLWERFREHSRSQGGRIALSTSEHSLTFAEAASVADDLALAFARAGLREGDLVGLCLPNSLAFVPSYLALCRMSGVVALISPKFGTQELSAILRASPPTCLVVDGASAESLAERVVIERSAALAHPRLPRGIRLLFPLRLAADEAGHGADAGVALVKFTSGSTGRPKGIALGTGNLLAEAKGVAETLALSPRDRILAPVPLAHSYGFDLGVLSVVVSGASLSIRDGFVPRRALRDLAERDTSVFLGVPSMYGFLLETQDGTPPPLDHLRYVLSCTAPLAPERIRAFHERFGVPLCQHYGSSETGALATHVPAEVLGRPEAVGRPMSHVRLRILDADGRGVPAGSLGEVVADGPAVASGYWKGEPSQGSPFRDGSYWTGDLGFLDDGGFLTVRGRTDALINVGGLKVYPLEVEQALLGFPAVREAAVVGVSDAFGGQVVFAAVTLQHPATEKDLLAHCRAQLADYKVPRRVEIRTELPRTATGKVALRAEDFSS